MDPNLLLWQLQRIRPGPQFFMPQSTFDRIGVVRKYTLDPFVEKQPRTIDEFIEHPGRQVIRQFSPDWYQRLRPNLRWTVLACSGLLIAAGVTPSAACYACWLSVYSGAAVDRGGRADHSVPAAGSFSGLRLLERRMVSFARQSP